MICTIEGCKNKRANAGYGKYRKVCERHHHKHYNMNYESGVRNTRTKLYQMREDLKYLLQIAQEHGPQEVINKIEDLLSEKYKG